MVFLSSTLFQIVGLAKAMLSCCVRVDGLDDAVDIVGTGGDGADTVNISTGSTILAAAAGAKVAKVSCFALLGLSTLGLDAGGPADALIALSSKEAGPARRRAAAPMCWRRLGSTSSLDLRYRHVFLNQSSDSAYSILSTTMAAPLVHCFLVSCDFSIC